MIDKGLVMKNGDAAPRIRKMEILVCEKAKYLPYEDGVEEAIIP